MVIDSSALVAIVLREPEAAALARAVLGAATRAVAAPTLVEATAVLLARLGEPGRQALQGFLVSHGVSVVPMSPTAAQLACDAYARYGKGVGNPSVLNLGDCLAYGVARALGEPLLYKGDDFARTDVAAAPY